MYNTKLKCKICGMELSTGNCKTKIGNYIKRKILIRKHYHTKGEVLVYETFGIYISTMKKKWEK